VQHQGGLDLGGAEAVAGDVEHVVDAPGDPVVAVLVAARAVAGEVVAGILLEVGVDEALVVAVDGAHLAGQGRVMTRAPSPGPRSGCPRRRSTRAGTTPKKGRVAEPGLSGVAPGSGVIRWPPVSVCHQVSTMGQRSSPTTRWYHSQASGLIGSPTEPRMRSEAREVFLTGSSPARIRERMAVGAV
jgi:hypothetical protein